MANLISLNTLQANAQSRNVYESADILCMFQYFREFDEKHPGAWFSQEIQDYLPTVLDASVHGYRFKLQSFEQGLREFDEQISANAEYDSWWLSLKQESEKPHWCADYSELTQAEIQRRIFAGMRLIQEENERHSKWLQQCLKRQGELLALLQK